MSDEVRNRRSTDRPGRSPAVTFARLLTTSPHVDEVVRALVGILAWPVGASGAVIVRRQHGALRTLARYEEPLDPQLGVLVGNESEPCLTDIVEATAGLSPVLWTEPDHPSCRPMAAWPLESHGDHGDHLVLILAAPLSAETVTARVQGIPEVLSVYLRSGRPEAQDEVPVGPESTPLSTRLSQRQARILTLMADGLTMQQIAHRIGYSESTVRMESLAIYRALGVHDRHHAIDAAQSIGLLLHE